ncbi:putative quercetin-3-sulfate 4'-sulfotransferase [Helianthus annuus]|nr:putative quercetin-3-sulfate 4'-sulfotransferase [Helianthus annuus]KAJ0908971.1 putative quercetin-3-sulfate 4'-sulfotransferase [Helianthus annuus]
MSSSIEEVLEALPQHTCSWLKGKMTMHKYQDFWASKESLEGGILAQQNFKAEPSDVFLCSAHKTGTTWLKSLAFAIATREKFDLSASPLLTKLVHECVPCLEKQFEEIKSNHGNSSLPFVATHLPYASLPVGL